MFYVVKRKFLNKEILIKKLSIYNHDIEKHEILCYFMF